VYYVDFRQVSDDEVKEYIERAKTVGRSHEEAKA
jgi:predicted phosphoribosyltransferase